MGKLIVIEGTDGSGKSTQFHLMAERLEKENRPFRRLVFPRYSEESSALIRLYLGGAFGSKPGDVNAYAASAFYAVDRYASYKQDWGNWYEEGGLIFSDRYTTSNAVHQGAKCAVEERGDYLRWLDDFEHNKLGLPRPDMVIYLDVPTEASVQMLRSRESATNTTADIHEKDTAYLATCRECAGQAADLLGWKRIRCLDENGKLRSIEDIHEEIWALVEPIL